MTSTILDNPLPAVMRLFADLVGRDVSGVEQAPVELSTEGGGAAAAVYVDDSGEARAVFLMGLELAASLAAALVMLPAGLVEDCVADKALNPNLTDNLFEVLNVASQLINRPGGAHHRIRQMIAPGGALPDDAATIVAAASGTVGYQVSVPGYGAGPLVIYAA